MMQDELITVNSEGATTEIFKLAFEISIQPNNTVNECSFACSTVIVDAV